MTILLLLLGFQSPDWLKDAKPIGRSACMDCHDDDLESYEKSPHGMAIKAMPKEHRKTSCEVCHGPGSVHEEDPTPDNILVLEEDNLETQKTCLSCHQGLHQTSQVLIPAHSFEGVTCVSCHIPGHKKPKHPKLLVAEEKDMCQSCHVDVKSQFTLAFAHRNGRQNMDCSECHSLHQHPTKPLSGFAKNTTCGDCHASQNGPFAFPHLASFGTSCNDCHVGHGSVNPFLLTRFDPNQLCMECHVPSPIHHELQKPQFRDCVSCHQAVHGSHKDPNLLEE